MYVLRHILRPFLLVWGLLVFAFAYAVCFPVFTWGLKYMKDRRPLHALSACLAKVWMVSSGLLWRVRYEEPLDRSQAYVFCANHSSYLDVPTLFTMNRTLVFVGKSSLARLPLFGYMYKRMHIVLDRGSMRSRGEVLPRARATLDRGDSLVFFPEGGICSKTPPRMARFYEGAFRTAIESQVPIVPVTILYNWMIFPKYRPSFVDRYRHRLAYYVHVPISTRGMTVRQVPELMEQVRTCIEMTLSRHFPSVLQHEAVA